MDYENNNNNDEDFPYLPYEIHDIDVAKIGEDEFRIFFGTKGDIEGLFKRVAEIDISRDILERFARRASQALAA